jgi:hypothetical protein
MSTMRRTRRATTSSVGLTQTKLAIESELEWLFREQPMEDYGIDAHAEVVQGEGVTGKLLGLQIKSGSSWFKEPTPGGWWFRPDVKHVRYWTNHSLPVVVVLYRPESARCYWQLVNAKTLVETAGGWKMLIPEAQVLDKNARRPLREAAEGDPYVLRIRELQLARPWMDLLAEGKRLVIDVEEWINKSSGRGSLTLGVDNEDGRDPKPLAVWGVFLGPSSYADVLPELFAWADLTVHEETYDQADHEQFEAECVVYDEGDRFEVADYSEWMAARELPELRPYANGSGEVDYWRLELTLNQLGKAFLVVNQFAMETSGS